MFFEAKCILIGRRKAKVSEDLPYVVDVKLFDINNPHVTTKLPIKELEFEDALCVQIKGLEVDYCIMGNDLVMNNAGKVKITQKGDKVLIEKSV